MSRPLLSRPAGSLLQFSACTSKPSTPIPSHSLRRMFQTRTIPSRPQTAKLSSPNWRSPSIRQSSLNLRRQAHLQYQFHSSQRRSSSTSYTPPPGPILTRDPNRPLPTPQSSIKIWARTLPLFALAIAISALAIFNYQKSNSSTVSSILYALRRNQGAREILGDEIYFASSVPWVRGTMNQLHGKIDISFWVKGTKGKGQTRFWAERRGGRGGVFETVEWSLKTEDGQMIQLLNEDGVMPVA